MGVDALNNVSLNALNNAKNTSNPIGEAVGLVMLDKQLEFSDTMNDKMLQSMEHSVNPAVGSNIDVYV